MKSAAPTAAIKEFRIKSRRLKCLEACRDARSEPIAGIAIKLVKPVKSPKRGVLVFLAQSVVADMCFDKHLIGGDPADVVYREHRIAQVIKHSAEKDGIKVT